MPDRYAVLRIRASPAFWTANGAVPEQAGMEAVRLEILNLLKRLERPWDGKAVITWAGWGEKKG